MRHRHEITDEQWERVRYLLPGQPGQPGATVEPEENRLFLNAILYVARTGIPWRDLPERFGKWDNVYQRFNRWCRKRVWQTVMAALQEPDLEWLILDSSMIRAHQHAAGAEKKGGRPSLRAFAGWF